MNHRKPRVRHARNSHLHPKPLVAYRNEDDATNNLENKTAILEVWLRNGIPVQQDGATGPSNQPNGRTMYEYYPRTLRQFNSWDGRQNSATALQGFASLKVNANDTLRKRPELRARIVDVISSLKELQLSDLKPVRRDRVSELKQQLSLETSMRQRLEAALIELRRENNRLTRDIEAAISQKDTIVKESHKAIASLESELERHKSKRELKGRTGRGHG